MKRCAQNPGNPEYTLCGNAEDNCDIEDFTFAVSSGDFVNCNDCLKAIAEIHNIFTPKGKIK